MALPPLLMRPRSKLYPELIQDVQIRVVELMDHVLSTYDRQIGIYTAEQFKRSGAGGFAACGCLCANACVRACLCAC